ncbi:MAG: hypothetical protein AB7I42_01240 [Bradyrhizobium sp.]|uniref:phosphorylase family protein n=1 Tax=Bradyrhizobium sp. TaxID=376 RepID=UPI003D139F62
MGKNNKHETIGTPIVRSGLIACAAVSGSEKYNKDIRALDRKILAVETESGGLFAVAKRNGIPALTIRGVSDYAGHGVDKNVFELETKNKARLVAVTNATTYLVCQLQNPGLIKLLKARRVENEQSIAPLTITIVDRLANTLLSQSAEFDARLKELNPGFSLQNHGYRIPVPRVRVIDEKVDALGVADPQPIELKEALKRGRISIVGVPPQYPDRSLAWVFARDLLSESISDRKIIPAVIEAHDLHRPRRGITAIAEPNVISFKDEDEALLVFVINEFDFSSRTQIQFLLSEVNSFPNAKFIIVTRNKSNIVDENQFARKTSATLSYLDDVSFAETSHFLQKNFEMTGPEAEVIAIRLRETFSRFKLSAHPSYFAGIPATTLIAILRANRRAELIELAVVGYLSYVVAQDSEPLPLSRTTREKFLTLLAFEIKANKRRFKEQEIVRLAAEFAERFDFRISASRFVAAFIEKGILYLDGDHVSFTLPFMEAYLLAKKLHSEPSEAIRYFEFGMGNFDARTFGLYAELGLSDGLLAKILERLNQSIDYLREAVEPPAILLSNQLQPFLLSKQERVGSLQRRLQKAITDVTNDNDASHEKQKLLDAADSIRTAARQSQETAKEEERRSAEYDAFEIWYVTISLLGSGAERLEAGAKRSLIGKVLSLSSLILEDWTRESAGVDYKDIKQKILENKELVERLSKTQSTADIAEAKRTLDGLVDILEYSFLSQPFRTIVQGLCEEARDALLAESIINTKIEDPLERLLHSVWLSDLDTSEGVKELNATLKEMPTATMLRMMLASHLITRVYWRHWNKDHRLKLLNAAQESLKAAGLKYDKAGLKRLIDREVEKED